MTGVWFRPGVGQRHLSNTIVSALVSKCITDTNEQMMSPSQIILVVSGRPDSTDFIDNKPGNVVFEWLGIMSKSLLTKCFPCVFLCCRLYYLLFTLRLVHLLVTFSRTNKCHFFKD